MAKVAFTVELELSDDPSHDTVSDVYAALYKAVDHLPTYTFENVNGAVIYLVSHSVTIA